MSQIDYRGRRAYALENDLLRLVVTAEGGHIAEVLDKATGVNPLWWPPWPTIEPSSFDPARHREYGADAESKLLAGILGHNLCLDVFGGPSDAEAAAGLTVHGEAPVASYDIVVAGDKLTQRATLFQAQLAFSRTIELKAGSRVALVSETVENLAATDRPVAWTQHVTLGPPFLEKGRTCFRISATRSKVIEHDFTGGKGYMQTGADFDWPMVPCQDGSQEDMRLFTNRSVSGAFSTHLMDPARPEAWFMAWSPTHPLVFGYAWRQTDFPWLGIWEENYSRSQPPWNGKTLTRGMEFGVSPFPETRRAMIERGRLFGTPAYLWIPAKTRKTVNYRLFLIPADRIFESPPSQI